MKSNLFSIIIFSYGIGNGTSNGAENQNTTIDSGRKNYDSFSTGPQDPKDLPPGMQLDLEGEGGRDPVKELLLGVGRDQGITYACRIRQYMEGPESLIFEAFGSDNLPLSTFNDGKPLALNLDLSALGVKRSAYAESYRETALIPFPGKGMMLVMRIWFTDGERFIGNNPLGLPYDYTLFILGVDNMGGFLNYFVRDGQGFPYTIFPPIIGEDSFFTFERAAAVDSSGRLLIAVTSNIYSRESNKLQVPDKVIVFRLDSQGDIDTTFGKDGYARIPFPKKVGVNRIETAKTQSLQVRGDGSLVITGSWDEIGFNSDGFFRIFLDNDGNPITCENRSQVCVYRNQNGDVIELDDFEGEEISDGFYISRFPAFYKERAVMGEKSVRWVQKSDVIASSGGSDLSVLLHSWEFSPHPHNDSDDYLSFNGAVDVGGIELQYTHRRPKHFELPYLGRVTGGVVAPMESISAHFLSQLPLTVNKNVNDRPYMLRIAATGDRNVPILWATPLTEQLLSHAYYQISPTGGIEDLSAPQFGPAQKIEFSEPTCMYNFTNAK